jgi:hypothetical protein
MEHDVIKHDVTGSEFRTFSNPADRTTWAWIAGAVIVAVVLTLLATAGSERPQVAAGDKASERALVPPITQPTAPAEADQARL